jgi:hypothetical protein
MLVEQKDKFYHCEESLLINWLSMNQQKATTPLDYEHNPMLQTNNLHLHNKQHLLRTRKTFQNHSVFSQVG